jgi:diketogulonate reductase-like aldo/keto reductase
MSAIIKNQTMPKFFYGTAWKEDRTSELTLQALQLGFRAIDTANQRTHSFAEAVGLGIKKFLELNSSGKLGDSKNLNIISRKDLFLQTKYTYSRGQDHRKPYNESDSFTQQVRDSFASSLKHLNTDYLDSFILHGPYNNIGVSQEDLETWKAMENLWDQKKVNHLGISNVSIQQLAELCKTVSTKPHFVQNRCFARFNWDKDIREFCKISGIFYQGFSLLTANSRELTSPIIVNLAQKYQKTIPQIIFKFCQQKEIICLIGSINPEHLKQDLDIINFELSQNELLQIENISF